MKIKLIILLSFLRIIIPKGFSQTMNPQVNASAGTHFQSGNSEVSFTIGEPVIVTLQSGNNKLTQGFHQTLITIKSYLISFNKN